MTQAAEIQLGYGTVPGTPVSGKVSLHSLTGGELQLKNDAAAVLPLAMYRIASTTLIATGNITFSAIPQTYAHLMMMGRLKSIAAAWEESIYAKFNGNSSANYYGEYIQAYNANVSGGITNGAAQLSLGVINAGTQPCRSPFRADFPNYALEDYPTMQGELATQSTNSPMMMQKINFGGWLNVSGPITSITIGCASGFDIGSTLSLYAYA